MVVGSSEVYLEDLTILILSTMIKKKNYKEQDHFSNFQSVSVCAPGGKKFLIYFKRHRSSKVGGSSLYDLMHSKKGKQSSQTQTTNTSESNYSEDRTLELISFDGSLGFFKQYLRKLGKIRKYETGEGTYDGNTLHYGLCVFKFEFDLVKCFREDYFENMMEEASKSVEHSEDKEEERYNIIKQYMGDELKEKVEKLQQMQEDGFQVVTDIYGQYRLDREANEKFVQNLPQIKKRKKNKQKQERLKEMERLRQMEAPRQDQDQG